MKPGRNDPCSCGSGKKYKNCCMHKAELRSPEPTPAEVNPLIMLLNAGRHAELESGVQLLLKRYPDYGIGWHLLGASLQAQSKNGVPALQQAAELLPADAAVHNNLGNALNAAGQLNEAAASYRRALKINPDFALAHSNLGHTLNVLGQFDSAVASCRRAVALQPNYAEAHNHLGGALQALGQLHEAADSYRRVVALQPGLAAAHNSLGMVLGMLGQYVDAAACFRRALELNPDYAEAHSNLGNALTTLVQFDEAAASCRRAVALKPDFAAAHNNLGNALTGLGQLDSAVSSFYRAIELKPDYAHAHHNLGIALQEQCRFAEAEASCRRALEIKPDYTEAYDNLLFTMNYNASHSPAVCLEVARQYGRIVAGKVAAKFSAWQCAGRFERLRVGMVSGDLRNHPVGYFLESLLSHIDPARIELIAYPTDSSADALTARIKPYFSAWKPLSGLSDAEAAQMIHDDGVHVLMDLSGHTRHTRLPVFAWKPAPVQVSWLGYFATTGVAEMDYLLADRMGVPEPHREHFSETVWFLPDTRLCFTPPDAGVPGMALPVAPLPALKNGHLTFGCFQRLEKVGDAVLTVWANIFAALPGARLYLLCKQLGDPVMAEQMSRRLQQHGIAPERVTMRGTLPREAYLHAHAEVDVFLDTFPYPGGTTTCEGLWMGVPTLTLAGETLLSRQGASLLAAAGLNDWIATSEPDYVAKAIALTDDLPGLAALRAGLRDQVRVSPLFDAPRFAHNLEAALWEMWQERGAKH